MPITKAAEKALRVSARKKIFNDRRVKAMKIAVKKVEKLAHEKKAKESKEALRVAYKMIDKAAAQGVIKKNNAARKKARLARLTKGV
ncbi:MAG TPA: 30S ribosomal protein S20 [Candidatus Paceibacterota bacterium]|nr:30S ribosomal protein S20 [Candidatus Paceibacterota bacterium]